MRPPFRLAVLLSSSLSLTACAPMLGMLGTNTALVQVVANIERVKLAADGASLASSKKTLNDHLISAALGKDCKVFNILTKESVCADTDPSASIAANDTHPADMAGRAGALKTSIQTASAGELPPEKNAEDAPVVPVNFAMQTDSDTSSRMATLASNIRTAAAREPQVVQQPDAETTLPAESPAKPQPGVVAVAGTNVVRQADPSIQAPASQVDEPVAPSSTKPHDQPVAAQDPSTIAHPAERSIDISRESASG